jgi:hypothetical protein
LSRNHTQRGIEDVARSTHGLGESFGVRQDVEQDCSKDEINDNFSDCAHESPPDFDDDNRQHNGDQNSHPVDGTEIELHLFLLFS